MRPGLSWRILERGTARGPRNPTNSPPSKLIHFLRSPGGLETTSFCFKIDPPSYAFWISAESARTSAESAVAHAWPINEHAGDSTLMKEIQNE
jgi:hypothetical protein